MTPFAVRLIEKLRELPFSVAVIIAVVSLVTADAAVTGKVTLEEPAFTVTGEATVADPLLLDTATLMLLTALPLKLIVQVELPGAMKLAGVQVRLDSTGTGACKVRVNVFEVPFSVAVTVTGVVLATGVVVTLKFALEEPAATVTGETTVAAPLLLDTVTLVLLGTFPLSVMVQTDPAGGVTLPGLQLTPVSVGVGGNNVTEEVLETPLNVAVIVTGVELATAVVVTLKLAVADPVLMVTVEGAVAAALLLATVTFVLLRALPLSVIVQEKPVGGVTLPGLQLRFERVGAAGCKVSVVVFDAPFRVAVIVTVVLLLTAVVVTLKLALADPALTVTGDETVAAPLLLETVTLVLLTALPLSVTVQVVPVGGVTVDGLQLTPPSTIAGVRVSEAVFETPFKVAVMVTGVALPTAVVDTLKFAVDEFAFTVTGDETVAAALLLDTVTLMLLGALPLKVTVQVDAVGGVRLLGLQFTPVSVGTGGNSVTPEVLETPFSVAVIVTGVELATAVVVTLKLALDAPLFTVTGDETVAEPLLLETVTLILLGALPLKVMVQEKPVGGVTLPGLHARLVSDGAGGSKVTFEVLDVPFNVAVMVTGVELATAVVVTLTFALDAPLFTVTGEETVAEPLLLDTVTLMLLGALPLSVMAQENPVGGVTLDGLQLRPVSVGTGGSKVTLDVFEVPFKVAVIVTGVELATAVVVTLKLAPEEPVVTITGEETVADPLLLETVTLMLLGALPLSVMVQEKPVGGVTLPGLQLRPVNVGAGGNKVTLEFWDAPFSVAVIITGVETATAVVVTLKLAEEDPAFTVTGDVTVADPLLLDTVTLVLLGALPLSVMVQEKPVGGVTLPGLQLTPVSVGTGGNSVTFAV